MVDTVRKNIYTRRTLFLSGAKLALMAGLASRMYYLQVSEGEKYSTMAEENRISLKLIRPTRGEIVDRYGERLATNVQNYRVLIVPKQAGDVQAVLQKLSYFIDMSQVDFDKVMKKTKRFRSFVPQVVRKNLTWEEVSRIGVQLPDLPGLEIDEGETRFYPNRHLTAHVIGYVGAPSETQMKKNPLLELPDFRVGEIGLERGWERKLRGVGGTKEVEVDALGRVVRELSFVKPQSGGQLVSTLDIELQRVAMAELEKHRAGAVVVMDAQQGDILAMASWPSHDTNNLVDGISHEDWKVLSNAEHTPLTNRATHGQYAPGSTFKMMVAMAAMEIGISPEKTVFCNGVYPFGNIDFHCWKKEGHGTVDLKRSIVASCDIWYYEMAKKIGIQRIGDMAKKFGLGQSWNIELGRLRKGLIPTKAWKMAVKGKPWQVGETMIAGIGQGYVLATPLQLAVMTSRIATGRAVEPFLTRDIVIGDKILPRPSAQWDRLGVSEDALNLIRESMVDVVNDSTYGTAKYSAISGPFRFAGKTGTSQVRRISKAERESGVLKNAELEWKFRDHALFVGYAPLKNPKYTVAVIVEHGGGGSSIAAPIAKTLFKKITELSKLPRHELEKGDGNYV